MNNIDKDLLSKILNEKGMMLTVKEIEDIMDAALNFTLLEPKAVPKIFEASFAPNDHPKNNPLLKKNKYVKSIKCLSLLHKLKVDQCSFRLNRQYRQLHL